MEWQEIVITVRKSKPDTLHGEIRLDGESVAEAELSHWNVASVDLLANGLLQRTAREKQLQ